MTEEQWLSCTDPPSWPLVGGAATADAAKAFQIAPDALTLAAQPAPLHRPRRWGQRPPAVISRRHAPPRLPDGRGAAVGRRRPGGQALEFPGAPPAAAVSVDPVSTRSVGRLTRGVFSFALPRT